MTIDVNASELTADERSLTCPYPVEQWTDGGDVVVVLLGAWQRERTDGRDFDLPGDGRNVLAFDRGLTQEWVVDDRPPCAPDGFHRELWVVQNRYLTRHDDYHFEYDPDDGSIVNRWERNELPVGDRFVRLSGTASSVVELDGAVFVGLGDGGHGIQAFEADGTERWRSDPDVRRGSLYEEDGELREVHARDRTTDVHYRVDPATGDRFEGREVDSGYW